MTLASVVDFLLVNKTWKHSHSKRCNYFLHTKDRQKDKSVGKVILCTFLNTIAVVLLCFGSSQSRAESVSEAQLKTIYLFNFSRFVQWPEPKKDLKIFQFCTYPKNPFGETLHQLEKRTIKTKPVQINELSSVNDIKSCHAVYIALKPDADLSKVTAVAQKHHVLTISDQQDFVNRAGMIQMFIVKGKIRFNINYDSSLSASLQIDSKLMQLASDVIKTD